MLFLLALLIYILLVHSRRQQRDYKMMTRSEMENVGKSKCEEEFRFKNSFPLCNKRVFALRNVCVFILGVWVVLTKSGWLIRNGNEKENGKTGKRKLK